MCIKHFLQNVKRLQKQPLTTDLFLSKKKLTFDKKFLKRFIEILYLISVITETGLLMEKKNILSGQFSVTQHLDQQKQHLRVIKQPLYVYHQNHFYKSFLLQFYQGQQDLQFLNERDWQLNLNELIYHFYVQQDDHEMHLNNGEKKKKNQWKVF